MIPKLLLENQNKMTKPSR